MKNFFTTISALFCVISITSSQNLDTKYGIDGRQLVPARNTYVQINSAIVQSNKKLLVAGSTFNDDGSNGKLTVWRLNQNGSLDSSFGNLGLPGITELFYGYSPLARGGLLALQADNKILVCGTNVSVAYPNVITLARLKTNGKLDSTFGENGAAHFYFNGSSFADAIPYGIGVKSNNKIVINGDITLLSGNAELIQVRPDGELDSSFGVNGVLAKQSPDLLRGIALIILPDNRILAGFEHTAVNGKVQTCLKRYSPTGMPDGKFGTGGIVLNKNPHDNDGLMALALQADGKIVEYTVGQDNNILLRYKKDGEPDNSFGDKGRVRLPFRTNSTLTKSSVVIDEKGNILITADGFSIARYLTSGVIDSSFGINGFLATDFSDIAPDYATQTVRCVAVQPDAKVLAIGELGFGYEVNDKLAIARYKNTAPAALVSHNSTSTQSNTGFILYPNPTNKVITVSGLNAKEQYRFEVCNATGTIMLESKINYAALYNCNVEKLNSGVYYVRLISNSAVQTLKFVKQ